MATEKALRVKEANDEVLKFTLTSSIPGYTLAGKSFKFVVKRYRSDTDGEALISKNGPGVDIVVDDAALLKLSVKISDSEMPEGDTYFYRLDVIDGAVNNTAMYGPFVVEDL